MKRNIIAALSIASIWLCAAPVFFVIHILPKGDILRLFAEYGAVMPSGSAFFVHHITHGSLLVLTIVASAIAIFASTKAKTEESKTLLRICIIVVWQLLMLGTLYGRSLPLWRMGEVVTDEATENGSQQDL